MKVVCELFNSEGINLGKGIYDVYEVVKAQNRKPNLEQGDRLVISATEDEIKVLDEKMFGKKK